MKTKTMNAARWSGFWYVNVDRLRNSTERNWEDCRKLGFLGGGAGRLYSDPLKKLEIGDQVFAYQPPAGYVGYGTVTQTVQPANTFLVDGKSLSECVQWSSKLLHDQNNPDLREYIVGINWTKTFSIQEAKRFKGAFAYRHVVCKLTEPSTLKFLKNVFDIT